MIPIRLEQVSKHLGETRAVDAVDLTIGGGELFFLLGPSGCGKTTLLNLIAGLLEPSSGRIWFGDRDVTALPTHQRNAVMCFQSYALWPHLSVSENIRFGLSVRKLPRREQDERIDEALALVRMQQFADRKPAELSGGQQQRVAIARATAVRPACLLLDEPLSNLDTRLRQEMRGEIRSICRSTGLTTVYVTHDQKEALSIADRIAIMKAGRVVQVGAPAELYARPATAFVAEFMGQSNLIAGRILERVSHGEPASGIERVRVDTALGPLVAFADRRLSPGAERVTLAIRPEQVSVVGSGATSAAAPADGENRVPAELVESWFLGDSSEHLLRAGGVSLRMQSVPPRLELPREVTVLLGASDLAVLGEAG
jgi:ABC-type Fe3+/spermidine/putrescine transport system ATPase subunit